MLPPLDLDLALLIKLVLCDFVNSAITARRTKARSFLSYLLSYLSRSLAGRWGTTVDFKELDVVNGKRREEKDRQTQS